MKYYSKSTRFLFPRNVDDKKSEKCMSWLKYLRRAYITHCLRKGTKGIIRLWRHNKKQETNTSNDKPCWEATVRMAVVCILVWYFFNRGLYLKVVFFFRYQTAIARNLHIFNGDILVWVLWVVGTPNRWKTKVLGRKKGKNVLYPWTLMLAL